MTYRMFYRMGSFFSKRTAALLAMVLGSVLSSACKLGPQLLAESDRCARAVVLPTAGHVVRGTVLFIERGEGMQIAYNLSGLRPKQLYAFEIHALGDCNAADGSSAGPIFRLRVQERAEKMGTAVQKYQLEGVLPKLRADINGVATGFVLAPELALGGLRSVLGRSVLVRRDIEEEGSAREWPAPIAASSRLACGVIRRQ